MIFTGDCRMNNDEILCQSIFFRNNRVHTIVSTKIYSHSHVLIKLHTAFTE